MPTVQVSAPINVSTMERLERRALETGATWTYLIEQALQYYLQAMEVLPHDVLVPTRFVLNRESAARVRHQISHPPRPTKAMKRLFDDR